jgi:hypothetical protein
VKRVAAAFDEEGDEVHGPPTTGGVAEGFMEREIRQTEAEVNVAGSAHLPKSHLPRYRLLGRRGIHSSSDLLDPYWEDPPYGIVGRTMETSASFEVRSAPSSYPTHSLRSLQEHDTARTLLLSDNKPGAVTRPGYASNAHPNGKVGQSAKRV